MHADRKPHEISDQYNPARGVGLLGLLFPFEHEPHHQSGEHRRERVYLALDSREPKGVGEGISQCSDSTGTQHRPGVGHGKFTAVARDKPTGKVCDGPEKKKDAESAGERVHAVDSRRNIVGIAEREQGGQTRQHHEQRCPGRVPHFELIRGGDELRAVPKTRHGLHRKQIDDGSYSKNCPADNVVPTFEKIHVRNKFRFANVII